jgi:glycosyltransferase involved in cell wall biosynthesis
MESNSLPARLTASTVCLNMIVRNEAAVIERCLASVRPFIDCWVIVDTGSVDDTPQRIQSALAGVPGELHHRPWRDFGHNRSEALALARSRADYLLFIDADETLRVDAGAGWPKLDGPAYALEMHYGDLRYERVSLVCTALPWRWLGVLHEFLEAGQAVTQSRIAGFRVEVRPDGARSRDPQKFAKDAEILRAALQHEPGNSRYVFYLAQSYRDCGQFAIAREHYEQRAGMGGWDEEVWYSLYQIARLSELLGDANPAVVAAYLRAYSARPARAETLVALARYHRLHSDWPLAYLFAKAASALPQTTDRLFVESAAYGWSCKDELALASYWSGNPKESFALNWSMLDEDRVPQAERARIETNRDFSVPAVAATTLEYPAAGIKRLQDRMCAKVAGLGVTLTITSCKRLDLFERTVNSFVNCCRDIDAIDRFVCIDDNSSAADRQRMKALYPFMEFIFKGESDKGHARSMNLLLDTVSTPWWLHLEDDWHFFVGTDYITRSMSIMEARDDLAQVMFNRNYAETLEDRNLVGGILHSLPGSGLRYIEHEFLHDRQEREAFFGRYPGGALSNVWWPHFSLRPSLMRAQAIKRLGRFDESAAHFEQEFASRYVAAGLKSAFFDAVTNLRTGRLTTQRGSAQANANSLNQVRQF